MADIEGRKVYEKGRKNINTETFQAYIGLLLIAVVQKSYGESTKNIGIKKLTEMLCQNNLNHVAVLLKLA